VRDPGADVEEGSSRKGGLFLVLEGVEGVGKTTQARLLLEWMEGLGLPACLAREPGGTPAGEAIREILLARDGLEIQAETELLLMLAARAAFVREVVRPLLGDGGIMLADRFETSTFAYQGFGRGLPLEEVRRLNRFATGGLQPDLVMVLDLPWEEGRARQQREGKTADRIESGGDAFLSRVRDGYRRLARDGNNVVLVDGSASPERVQGEIRHILRARFPETFDLSRCSEVDDPASPADDEPEDLP
jgi:dTMP kinase